MRPEVLPGVFGSCPGSARRRFRAGLVDHQLTPAGLRDEFWARIGGLGGVRRSARERPIWPTFPTIVHMK
jgi:hypothetical protein